MVSEIDVVCDAGDSRACSKEVFLSPSAVFSVAGLLSVIALSECPSIPSLTTVIAECVPIGGQLLDLVVDPGLMEPIALVSRKTS